MGNDQEPVSSCYEKGIFTSFDLCKSGCWANTAKELTGLQGVVKFIAFQFAEGGPCSAVDVFYIGRSSITTPHSGPSSGSTSCLKSSDHRFEMVSMWAGVKKLFE